MSAVNRGSRRSEVCSEQLSALVCESQCSPPHAAPSVDSPKSDPFSSQISPEAPRWCTRRCRSSAWAAHAAPRRLRHERSAGGGQVAGWWRAAAVPCALLRRAADV